MRSWRRLATLTMPDDCSCSLLHYGLGLRLPFFCQKLFRHFVQAHVRSVILIRVVTRRFYRNVQASDFLKFIQNHLTLGTHLLTLALHFQVPPVLVVVLPISD